ncbi:MAG: Hpt domain-containing protein [Pseudomonadota bacterium]
MTDDILDFTALKRLLDVIGGDEEDFEELKSEFLENTPETVANLKIAVEQEDWKAATIAAHTLKGNARDFGAVKLEAASVAMETACKDVSDALNASALVQAVEAAEGEARAALSTLKVADLG